MSGELRRKARDARDRDHPGRAVRLVQPVSVGVADRLAAGRACRVRLGAGEHRVHAASSLALLAPPWLFTIVTISAGEGHGHHTGGDERGDVVHGWASSCSGPQRNAARRAAPRTSGQGDPPSRPRRAGRPITGNDEGCGAGRLARSGSSAGSDAGGRARGAAPAAGARADGGVGGKTSAGRGTGRAGGVGSGGRRARRRGRPCASRAGRGLLAGFPLRLRFGAVSPLVRPPAAARPAGIRPAGSRSRGSGRRWTRAARRPSWRAARAGRGRGARLGARSGSAARVRRAVSRGLAGRPAQVRSAARSAGDGAGTRRPGRASSCSR